MLFNRNYTCTLFTTVSTVITLVTVLIGCCVCELLCPHRNVWPKNVYTRTTLFTETFWSELVVSITSPSVVLLVSEIAKCIA